MKRGESAGFGTVGVSDPDVVRAAVVGGEGGCGAESPGIAGKSV